MPTFLLDHMPGCTPVNPCESCIAAHFLRSKLSEADFKELIAKIKPMPTGKPPYSAENPAPLEASIEILNLTLRSKNCLAAVGILTIGDLVKKSEIDLLKISNFGRRSLNEIKAVLELVGRHLGETF